MKILITGATGFVGKKLVSTLINEGYEINILTRNIHKAESLFRNKNISIFEWADTHTLPPRESIVGINGVINLMGENIGQKKWSDTQKEILSQSRIDATKNLITLINQNNLNLDFFISSSAIGIYPSNTNETLDENSSHGEGFLANLCKAWEAETTKLLNCKRVCILRTSVILESHDGALKKMLTPFKLGLGGPIGNGLQYMSWIHLDDMVGIILSCIKHSSFNGVINAVSNNPVTNYEFTKALGKALNRPTLFMVPPIALKLALGEMSSIILDSQKVKSHRMKELGHQIKYDNIESALNSIFKGN